MKKRSLVQAWLMILTGAGIILFWIVFFSINLVPEDAPACYLAFALGLIAAGVLMLRGRPAGERLSLVNAGGLLFLGLIDISFNLQNGIYGLGLDELISMAAINIWCVAFGASLIIWPAAAAD